MSTLDQKDLEHLRTTIELSRRAKARGSGPYGALLVGADGCVLAEAENDQVTSGDCTGHAETNLVRRVAGKLDAATLAGATLYASAEPCAMCAGAIFWSGVKRVVYALSSARNYALCAPSEDELHLGCREVLAAGRRKVEVVGPALEDEAARVFGT